MGIKSKLLKLVDKATVKAVDALGVEVEEDSFLDLKLEQIEGREHVDRPIVPVDAKKPVYRRDGQIHSFSAVPWPGQKRLTQAQYDARYGGARPVPKHNVSDGLGKVTENDFDTNPPESMLNRDGSETEARIDGRNVPSAIVEIGRK